MKKDMCTLVFKITLSTGEQRNHSYYDCPVNKEEFSKWFDEQMENVFTKTRIRHWFRLKNPTIFYNIDHIVSWEFEHDGNEEFTALLEEKTDFMLQIVGPD